MSVNCQAAFLVTELHCFKILLHKMNVRNKDVILTEKGAIFSFIHTVELF